MVLYHDLFCCRAKPMFFLVDYWSETPRERFGYPGLLKTLDRLAVNSQQSTLKIRLEHAQEYFFPNKIYLPTPNFRLPKLLSSGCRRKKVLLSNYFSVTTLRPPGQSPGIVYSSETLCLHTDAYCTMELNL